MTKQIPKKGEYYYHYKHDASKGLKDHCYVIVGIGKHSEDESYYVVYTPLYLSGWMNDSKAEYALRPLDMFMEEVERRIVTEDGYREIVEPRFRKLEQSEIELIK